MSSSTQRGAAFYLARRILWRTPAIFGARQTRIARKHGSRAVPGWFHPAPSSAYAQRGRVCPCAYRLAGERAL